MRGLANDGSQPRFSSPKHIPLRTFGRSFFDCLVIPRPVGEASDNMQKKRPKSTVHLPEILIAGRTRLGLSQDSLAEKAALSRSIVTRIEGLRKEKVGARSIELRLSTLDSLAKGLGMDVRDLLCPSNTPPHGISNQPAAIRVAGNLVRWRKERDFSQLELSEKTGHFRTYIHRLETLRFVPVISDVEGIAAVLEIDNVAELFRPLTPAVFAEYLHRIRALTVKARTTPAASS